jgi:uncharacterized protein (TIGR02246 family)
MRYAAASVLFTAFLAGCGGPPTSSGPSAAEQAAEDVAAIRALQLSWNDAVARSDVAGYLEVLDPEVELLPTDAPPIVGSAGYAAMLEGIFATDTFKIDVLSPSTIEVAGDWAWARYDYVIHRTPIGSEQTFSAERKFLDVLRRQADGSWGVYRHIWNYNTPDATP